MVGVATKLTKEPEHSGFDPSIMAILTVGVTAPFMVMLMPFDTASVGLAHGSFDVISHVTIWPLVSAEVVNVALFVPAFDPFIFH